MPPPNFALDAAVDASRLSPCRSKRGVAVYAAQSNLIVGLGHNQQVAPFECDGSLACKVTCREMALHAEQAALLQAGKSAAGCDMLHVKTVDGALVPSGGPSCVQCSKLVVPAGILGVWLFHESGWRRYGAQEFHQLSVCARYGLEPTEMPQPAAGGAVDGSGESRT